VRVLGSATDVAHGVAVAASAVARDGLVLFSPAAPTPPAVGDWAARSASFRRAVAELRAGAAPDSVG
jgi:hypothetical protein